MKIAFCGYNTSLCHKLAKFVAHDVLNNYDAVFLQDSRPEISELVDASSPANMDWRTLWSAVQNRFYQLNFKDSDLVVSPTCGIDLMAAQAVWLKTLVEQSQGLSIVNAQGEAIPQNIAMINRTGSVLQVIVNQTEDEMEYWDKVYAVIPAIETVGSNLQNDVIAQYKDFLDSGPAFKDVIRLPDNESSAMDILRQEFNVKK